eukprot:CAMPEP_0194297832 /NCGR_PEP_ID=MMETSP0169-20130528/59831_1 /TAXON_ID=218684 /ORGANISM="Corethron pennatum, Strain L29A3" /LENGTH=599 /DNA_ID=CAMNT_0039047751 /DNA_START=60 /DNA_END=1859 /DNA_ORIENTATION=+
MTTSNDSSSPKNHVREEQITSATIGLDMGCDLDEASKDNGVVYEVNQSCGRGIVDDFKQTVGTHWKAEMTNFNFKTIAVSFFLFFAAVAPAITFGAIYAKVTHNYIGAVEMIAATAWCGIFYALFGGMPIMINGGTGPVLAFAGVLYKLSKTLDVPFLTFNAWVGLWVTLYMFIAAFFDLNKLMKYATRFTDEVFALLISAIFIIDALGSPFSPVGVYHYFAESHKSHDEFEDEEDYSYIATALLSLILTLGTTGMAFSLKNFKFSPFCCNNGIRSSVTDFAVTASILLFTVLDKVVFKEVQTETLNVPDSFAPTFNCCTASCEGFFPDDCPELDQAFGRRPWVVDLFDLNGKTWVPIMAAFPAILAFILVFLDDGITWHLINHSSHKLKHGVAYNYDTVIIGFMIAVNSMFGLPWLVAATVRSLNHLHALGKKNKLGKFIRVQETRLTNFIVHALVLASIFALTVIKLIPVPVLYGVFLFMGLASLGTNQFWKRITMFFMQPTKFPTEPYTEHVKTSKMHMYTCIQLCLFLILYFVKSFKPVAITFPIIIAACIPIRIYLLPKMFSKDELIMLDAEDSAINDWKIQNGFITDGKVDSL